MTQPLHSQPPSDEPIAFNVYRLWEQLKDLEQFKDELIGQPFHANNVEMLMRMGEALGLSISAEATDDIWITITAIEPSENP